jgi:hypothetical protein
MKNNPIFISTTAGFTVLIITILVLIIQKPDSAMKVELDNTRTLDLIKVALISSITGIIANIVCFLYLIITRKREEVIPTNY